MDSGGSCGCDASGDGGGGGGGSSGGGGDGGDSSRASVNVLISEQDFHWHYRIASEWNLF